MKIANDFNYFLKNVPSKLFTRLKHCSLFKGVFIYKNDKMIQPFLGALPIKTMTIFIWKWYILVIKDAFIKI